MWMRRLPEVKDGRDFCFFELAFGEGYSGMRYYGMVQDWGLILHKGVSWHISSG